jgi:hypothetical protein
MEPTGFHGPETNTFLNTVVAAGLMALPVPLPIELTSSETELGLISHCRLKPSSIAEQEDHATVVIPQEFTSGQNLMDFQKKLAKLMKPKTQNISAALTFRNV